MNNIKPEALNETEQTALRAASEAFVLIRLLTARPMSQEADLPKLLDLVRKVENFDATLAASHMAGKAIEPTQDAYDQRKRHERRIVQLRDKWAI